MVGKKRKEKFEYVAFCFIDNIFDNPQSLGFYWVVLVVDICSDLGSARSWSCVSHILCCIGDDT
jgi:hypothetical protein